MKKGFLDFISQVADSDVTGLMNAASSYGESWKKRGGVGAFMMLARKWDRLEHRMQMHMSDAQQYDLFTRIELDKRAEGVMDDVRDLRRYLILVEAEMRARGYNAEHRDNKEG